MQPETPKDRPVVLVTGSSGLIGQRLVKALPERYQVVGLDRDPPPVPARETWIECDLTDDQSVKAALEKVRAQHGDALAGVAHLAAYYDFSGEPSPLYEELTVEGTRRMLHGLRAFRVGRFVFTSSLLVMEPVETGEVLREGSPVDAAWAYPRSKVAAEAVIASERGDVPVAVLRVAGVYDEDCHSIPIAQQIDRIARRKLESVFFPGDAEHGQSYVHLDDAVAAIVAAIERRDDLAEEELFLIGEPDVVPYREMQELLGEAIHGKAWPTVRIPQPVARAGAWLRDKLPGSDPFIQPWMVDVADAHRPISIERARERLGWEPEHRLHKELPEMVRRMQRDPEAWRAENGLVHEPAGAGTDG